LALPVVCVADGGLAVAPLGGVVDGANAVARCCVARLVFAHRAGDRHRHAAARPVDADAGDGWLPVVAGWRALGALACKPWADIAPCWWRGVKPDSDGVATHRAADRLPPRPHDVARHDRQPGSNARLGGTCYFATPKHKKLGAAGVGIAADELIVNPAITRAANLAGVDSNIALNVVNTLSLYRSYRKINNAVNPNTTSPEQTAGNPYSGVREASRILQAEGVPRHIRKQVLESFDVRTINVRAAGTDEFALRYFDGIDADPRGRFLFETFPASRQSLALDAQWNQMTGVVQWQLRPGAIVFEGVASPQGTYLPGGQIQKYVLDPIADLITP